MDGAAHQRMAKSQPAGRRGRAQQVGGEQRVDRLRQPRPVEAGDGGGEGGVDRVAGDRGAAQQRQRVGRQQRQLGGERGGDRRRDLVAEEPARDRARAIALARPRELQQVEGVAAALAQQLVARARVERIGQLARDAGRTTAGRARERVVRRARRLVARAGRERVKQQQLGGVGVERRERQRDRLLLGAGRRQRAGEARVELRRPVGEHERDRRARRAPHQRREQLCGRAVGPLRVVEHEHQPARHGEPLQQPAHGALQPVAGAGAVGVGAHRRQRGGQLGQLVAVEPRQACRVERADVVVERVGQQRERQLALELRRASGEHERAAGAGLACQSGQQRRLADPGLAGDRDDRAGARLAAQPRDDVAEHRELALASDRLLHAVGFEAQRRSRV